VDDLTRNILTQIQGGKSDFGPENASRESMLEFQATAKRIEWAKRRGYIPDTRSQPGLFDGKRVILGIVVLGGLTREGELALLEDPDDCAF
jgi:hypothetical protein